MTPLGIKIYETYLLNILLFADDLVLAAPTEDNLQKQIFYLDKFVVEYEGRISAGKLKTMGNSARKIKVQWKKVPVL